MQPRTRLTTRYGFEANEVRDLLRELVTRTDARSITTYTSGEVELDIEAPPDLVPRIEAHSGALTAILGGSYLLRTARELTPEVDAIIGALAEWPAPYRFAHTRVSIGLQAGGMSIAEAELTAVLWLEPSRAPWLPDPMTQLPAGWDAALAASRKRWSDAS